MKILLASLLLTASAHAGDEPRYPHVVPGRKIETCYPAVDRFSGSYFPKRLGGLRQNPEIWVQFQALLKPYLERENEERKKQPELGLEKLNSSTFCALDEPGLSIPTRDLSIVCLDVMDEAYKLFADAGQAYSPVVAKWDRVLKNRSIKREKEDELATPASPRDAEIRRGLRTWWAGYCDFQPMIEGVFSRLPPTLTIDDVTFEGDEVERLAINLARSTVFANGFLGDKNRELKPDELLKTIERFGPGEKPCLAGDFDPSPEIWNYAVRSIEVLDRAPVAETPGLERYRIRVLYGRAADPYEEILDLSVPTQAKNKSPDLQPRWNAKPGVQFFWWFNSTPWYFAKLADKNPALKKLIEELTQR